jgi:hypothetical protein
LGVSCRRVNQLLKDGIFEKTKDGKIHVASAILKYVRFKQRNQSALDFLGEKTLHEKAKRELAEMQVMTRRNELHDAAAVEQVMGAMLANVRTRLLGLGAALAPLLAGKPKEEASEIINSSIEEVLGELKDYVPELFSERAYAEDG